MNCANHPEIPATAFCRDCGKPLCAECRRPAQGSIFCAEHAPAASASFSGSGSFSGAAASFASAPPPDAPADSSSPYNAPAPGPVRDCHAHPALALILGFIPGVGAIYNGQYAKGLIHAVVFGLLVSLTSHGSSSLEPLLGIMIAAWVFYMAFEAFHTATKRRRGEVAEEFSSLIDIRPAHGRFPAGAVLLIGLGFILLLDTTDLINLDQLERYWPVLLIVGGFYMLYSRLSGVRDLFFPARGTPRPRQ